MPCLSLAWRALNIPAMGVEGAAWSTVASIWISCLSFCVLLSQRGFVDWTAAYSWPLALKDQGMDHPRNHVESCRPSINCAFQN